MEVEEALGVLEGLIQSESELLRPVFYIDQKVRNLLPERLGIAVESHPRWNLS